uniref:Uncharacterized protein n=1 Tax=Lotharella globosa TaxID=91324 RepID=A0A7S3Z1A3_9EUKA
MDNDNFVTYSVLLGVGVQTLILWVGCLYNFMDGWTMLSWASDRGYTSLLRQMIKWGGVVGTRDNSGETALVKASRNGHNDVVDALLRANADPNVPSKKGKTPLNCAAENGHEVIVQYLLKANADPDATPKGVEAPILKATRNGEASIVTLLASHKADVDIKGQMNRTPLVVACIRNQPACATALVEAKASLNISDCNGLTPLIWASVHGYLHIVKMLVANGAELNIHDKTHRLEYTMYYHRLHLTTISFFEVKTNLDHHHSHRLCILTTYCKVGIDVGSCSTQMGNVPLPVTFPPIAFILLLPPVFLLHNTNQIDVVSCCRTLRLANGAIADKTDLAQIESDLRRTWRKAPDHIKTIQLMVGEANRLQSLSARLAFLIGTTATAGRNSPIRSLTSSSASAENGESGLLESPEASKKILSNILSYLEPERPEENEGPVKGWQGSR